MSNYNNSSDPAAEKGCVAIIGLVVICVVAQTIINLVVFVGIAGGIGFSLYRLYMYDKRTGHITAYLERVFRVKEWGKGSDQSDLPYKESSGDLPNAPNQEILQQLNNIEFEVTNLRKENENLKTEQKKDLEKALVQIDRKNKKNLLDDIFKPSQTEGYARSDEFEKQQFQMEVKKKKEELEIRELKHEMSSQIFEQDKKLMEYRFEAKQDNLMLREEVRTGFIKVAETFRLVEKEMMTLQSYVAEKFSQLELNFLKEIGNIRQDMSRLQVSVAKEFSDVRLQFGKEVLRLDQQQVRIVDKVQTLHNQVKSFGVEMIKIKNDAERYSYRAEDMLKRADLAYQRHQVAIQSVSKDIDLNLKHMAMYKKDFALEVGTSKLQLERISQDQYLALKDISYEKMGINILRDEYQQRATLEQTKMQNLLAEQKRIEERIQEKISRGQLVDDLKHQLRMTQEDLRYTSNRANLMQQEFSAIRRHSKN